MTREERYVWDLVRAATVLPKPAIPFAAGLLTVPPLNGLPVDARANLLNLLQVTGSIEPSPAVEAFLAAFSAGGGPGAGMRSPHWHMLRLLQQEQHATAALMFLEAVAAAGVRCAGGETA